MLFLKMAPPFVVIVVKIHLAFCTIDVVIICPVVRFEAILGIEDLKAPQTSLAEYYRVLVATFDPYPVVHLTIPMLGFHVLHLGMCRIKVPIALLAVVMLRAVLIVLIEAALARKVDVAAIAYPMST